MPTYLIFFWVKDPVQVVLSWAGSGEVYLRILTTHKQVSLASQLIVYSCNNNNNKRTLCSFHYRRCFLCTVFPSAVLHDKWDTSKAVQPSWPGLHEKKPPEYCKQKNWKPCLKVCFWEYLLFLDIFHCKSPCW